MNYVCSQDIREQQQTRQMASDIYRYYFHGKPSETAVGIGGGYSEDASPAIILHFITDKETLDKEVSEISETFDTISSWYAKSFVQNYFETY